MNNIGRNELCPCGSGKKYKKCHYRKLFGYESEKITVCINRNGTSYKIFKIIFHNTKDSQKASIIISFPYHKNNNGLISLATFPGKKTKIKRLSLVNGGKVTSHKIKYTHWSDGNVHFSQDGKIYTLKKEPSDSLNSSIGHIFTIQLKGLTGFETRLTEKRLNSKETDIELNLPAKDEDDSIKLTGWWYASEVIHPVTDEYKKNYIFKQKEGIESICCALESPKTSPLNNMILLLCARREFMTKEKGSHLLFIGGFDKKDKSKDINNDLHFLSMLYPARNYEVLKKQIGTIDLPISQKDFNAR